MSTRSPAATSDAPTAPRSLPEADLTALEELQLEDEAIWTRDWVCVGLEQQIPAAGDLLPATAGHHGLHVQREPDGSLRAAFNALQYGSCWTIPAQCGHGHKTRCPYVSCAHALDTEALPGQDGAPTPQMRQFIGFNPLKLVEVDVQTAGPLIFVSLGDPPPVLEEQLGPLGRAAVIARLEDLQHVARPWAELDCNWKLASDALFATLNGRARLHRAFPNLVIAELDDHVAVVVIKPTRLDGVALVVALFAPPVATADEASEAAGALVTRWRSLTDDARLRSRRLAPSSSVSPILAEARRRLTAGGGAKLAAARR